jgi:4-diphosphocytidyl-2-C-methyl-D-erythritol kinase
MLTIHAPCKVNWYLEIPGRRPDGFHEIVTVMQTISLHDTLTLTDRSDGTVSFDCHVDLGPPEHNLVVRAARLAQRLAPGRGVHLSLTKRVPHGAGLGGGSSDGACALVALNRLWNLGQSNDQLRQLAAELGSDCAFFIEGGTALCTGRGEQVRQLADQTGKHLVILYPNDVCPTKDVYSDLARRLTYGRPESYFFHVFESNAGPEKIASVVTNRLQDSALRVSSRLADVWGKTAHETGVIVRFVSGSGSSIAFLVPDAAVAQSLARSLGDRGLGQAFATHTLPRGPRWE